MSLKQRETLKNAGPHFFFFSCQSWIILEAQKIHKHSPLLLGPFNMLGPTASPGDPRAEWGEMRTALLLNLSSPDSSRA